MKHVNNISMFTTLIRHSENLKLNVLPASAKKTEKKTVCDVISLRRAAIKYKYTSFRLILAKLFILTALLPHSLRYQR